MTISLLRMKEEPNFVNIKKIFDNKLGLKV